MTRNQIYSTGECYGCTVAVAASGKGVYLAHYREETGTVKTFNDDPIFEATVQGPFDDALEQHHDSFYEQKPNLVIVSPGNPPNYRYPRVTDLKTTFQNRYQDATVHEQGYRALPSTANAFETTAAGKVVVEWIAPRTQGGLAELNIYVESNQVVHVNYNAQGVLQRRR
jgi:hypothetical protein